jgi:hypothetical protein
LCSGGNNKTVCLGEKERRKTSGGMGNFLSLSASKQAVKVEDFLIFSLVVRTSQ